MRHAFLAAGLLALATPSFSQEAAQESPVSAYAPVTANTLPAELQDSPIARAYQQAAASARVEPEAAAEENDEMAAVPLPQQRPDRASRAAAAAGSAPLRLVSVALKDEARVVAAAAGDSADAPRQAVSSSRAALDAAIARHAQIHGVPETLVHRVVRRESTYNPRAVSKGNYGLMQIRLGTARALGYKGTAEGLLDAETNLTYAVRYLAGAYRVAHGNHDRAVSYYASGYYYVAKRQAQQARAARNGLVHEASAAPRR